MIGTGGPPLPWGTIAAVAAAGVLLLAFFHARAGGTVGPIIALLIATALAVTALALGRARPTRPRRSSRAPAVPPQAGQPLEPPPLETRQPIATAVQGRSEPAPLGAAVQRVATEIARAALAQLSAPAASVLVERGGRLTAAGSAGDWAAARRGLKDFTGPGLYDPSRDGGEPPEFPLDTQDDWLQFVLAHYERPVPMERWRELSDIPRHLLPLAALAASGVGVAVPLTRGRRLAGLCVLAQRPDAAHYTPDELTALYHFARQHGRALAEALDY